MDGWMDVSLTGWLDFGIDLKESEWEGKGKGKGTNYYALPVYACMLRLD